MVQGSWVRVTFNAVGYEKSEEWAVGSLEFGVSSDCDMGASIHFPLEKEEHGRGTVCFPVYA